MLLTVAREVSEGKIAKSYRKVDELNISVLFVIVVYRLSLELVGGREHDFSRSDAVFFLKIIIARGLGKGVMVERKGRLVIDI